MLRWRGRNIYLIGFMATGKSKVGCELARLLTWPFVDSDSMIERLAGKSIAQIFEDEGEQSFRRLENQVVGQLAQRQQHVVALGGGAVILPENWDLVIQSGLTICLYASPQVLFQRISKKRHRPLMNKLSPVEMYQKILDLLALREPLYRRADLSFESNDLVPSTHVAQLIFQQLDKIDVPG